MRRRLEGWDSYTTNATMRALLRLFTGKFFLSLFLFDVLAHFISSVLAPPTPLPNFPTKPRRLIEGGSGRRWGEGGRPPSSYETGKSTTPRDGSSAQDLSTLPTGV